MIDLSLRRKVPVLLQTEVAECGLACIAMVSQYMGSKLDLRTLRAQASVSQKGLSLDQLMHVADEFGLATRALRLELDELNALRLPAILHWDLNHYVVLTKVKASGIEIHDPAAGKKRLGLQEVSQHFTGVALELTRSEAFVAPVQVQKFSVWQL